MSEEQKVKKAPKKVVNHKEQFADHQEYCKLKLDYENLKKDAQKKYSKLEVLKELEKKVKTFEGKHATTKKAQGIAKLSQKGSKFFLSQDVPNPKLVMEKFTKEQQAQYFK